MSGRGKEILEFINEIDEYEDAGLFGFVIIENNGPYDETGESVISVFKRYPEHAELLNEMLIAVSGYGVQRLKDEMEEQRDYYESL